MPMRSQVNTVGGQVYGRPTVGVLEHAAQRAINVSVLTVNEVDSDGYLKPGVPFDRTGVLVIATVPTFGVSIEPIKVAAGNDSTSLTAAGTAVQVTLQVIGMVNRKIAEDNLGRAYTAAEIAGFDLAGSKLVLLY